MVVITLAEMRHDAPACLEALAEAGLWNLADPALRAAFTSRRISILLWVRARAPGSTSRTLPARVWTGDHRSWYLQTYEGWAQAALLCRPGRSSELVAAVQAYARLNRVDSGACRRFARALAERAMQPGVLDSNPQALGNVAWGLSVARLLNASTLQRVRRRPDTMCPVLQSLQYCSRCSAG